MINDVKLNNIPPPAASVDNIFVLTEKKNNLIALIIRHFNI